MNSATPLIGIVMGSQSDWETMQLPPVSCRSSAFPTRPASSRPTARPT
jgi:phosphoribosylcarboxyaminoimidazole (NCAIR) mutase